MNRTYAVFGFQPILAGSYGGGQPAYDLLTAQARADWYASFLVDAHNPLTQWAKPRSGMMVDYDAGGTFHFYPAEGLEGELPSAYEYRLQPQGMPAPDWQICSSFLLELTNDNYPAGSGVQVRHRAINGLTASPILTNGQDFKEHIFPLAVKGFSYIGSVLHTTLKVGANAYIAILTNGFNHGYQGSPQGGPYLAGTTIDFAFDFTGFEGQHQVITFNSLGQIDYTTQAFQTVVPWGT